MAEKTVDYILKHNGVPETELAQKMLALPSFRNRPNIKLADVIDCIRTTREH